LIELTNRHHADAACSILTSTTDLKIILGASSLGNSKVVPVSDLGQGIPGQYSSHPELTMGQWIMGHGSNGSTNLGGWVTWVTGQFSWPVDPWL